MGRELEAFLRSSFSHPEVDGHRLYAHVVRKVKSGFRPTRAETAAVLERLPEVAGIDYHTASSRNHVLTVWFSEPVSSQEPFKVNEVEYKLAPTSVYHVLNVHNAPGVTTESLKAFVEAEFQTEVLTVRQLDKRDEAFSFKLSVKKLDHYDDRLVAVPLPGGLHASFQWERIGDCKTAYEHRLLSKRRAAKAVASPSSPHASPKAGRAPHASSSVVPTPKGNIAPSSSPSGGAAPTPPPGAPSRVARVESGTRAKKGRNRKKNGKSPTANKSLAAVVSDALGSVQLVSSFEEDKTKETESIVPDPSLEETESETRSCASSPATPNAYSSSSDRDPHSPLSAIPFDSRPAEGSVETPPLQ